MAKIINNNHQNLIGKFLDSDENELLEFKRMLKKPSELLASIIALANAKGGYLFLGVEDYKRAKGNDRLIGISEGGDNWEEFLNMLSRNIQPLLEEKKIIKFPIENVKGKEDEIVLVIVSSDSEIRSTLSGDTYLRKGKSNRKIGNQEIIRLKYEKGSLKYEDEKSDILDLNEINYELFEEFKQSINSGGEDRQILKDNGLAIFENNKRNLKNGGVLLFGNNPSILLGGKYGIKISYYYGNSINYTGTPNLRNRPFTIEGPINEQIRKCVNFFEDLIKKAPPILSEKGFASTFRIPLWVIQEAITNAVIHRNYGIQNDIQIRIFDNRIEVESPGGYPGHITPANIKNERFSRNPMILRSLNRFNIAPNLDTGEGVDRMFQLMEENNLNAPLYSSTISKPHSVMVILYNDHKVEYWDTIKNYIIENGYITNQQTRAITGITETHKASRLLKKFVDSGFLKSEGEKKNTIYKMDTDYIIDNKLENLIR